MTKPNPSTVHAEMVAQLADKLAKTVEMADKPTATSTTAQVLSVVAYTNTDSPRPWTSEKFIAIPEGWTYFSHSWYETTGLNSRKITEPWVSRDPANQSRIIEVRIKVEAFAVWFARSWVGAQLDVTIVQ